MEPSHTQIRVRGSERSVQPQAKRPTLEMPTLTVRRCNPGQPKLVDQVLWHYCGGGNLVRKAGRIANITSILLNIYKLISDHK